MKHFYSVDGLLFQSTLPARGATKWTALKGLITEFQSTLPARGATVIATAFALAPNDFNPRSPHGERPRLTWWSELRKGFQSTLPARGATQKADIALPRTAFQSTLPARGATRKGETQ